MTQAELPGITDGVLRQGGAQTGCALCLFLGIWCPCYLFVNVNQCEIQRLREAS
jgi:hypothetical protein